LLVNGSEMSLTLIPLPLAIFFQPKFPEILPTRIE